VSKPVAKYIVVTYPELNSNVNVLPNDYSAMDIISATVTALSAK